ncbi:MAG: Hint domain-containing protein [Planctomycetota bacterium]
MMGVLGASLDDWAARVNVAVGSLIVAALLLAGHLSCAGLRASTRGLWRVAWMRVAVLLNVVLLLAILVARVSAIWIAPFAGASDDVAILTTIVIWPVLGAASAAVAVWSWRKLKRRFATRRAPLRVVVGLALSIVITIVGGLATIHLHWFLRSETSCVLAGTRIATPAGPRAVESLGVGDEVWSWSDDKGLVRGRVTATLVAKGAAHRAIHLDDRRVLRVTAVHPVHTPDGFLPAELIRRGDRLRTKSGWARVTAVEVIRGEVQVHDLTVGPHANFFANGIVVHNKEILIDPTDGEFGADPP